MIAFKAIQSSAEPWRSAGHVAVSLRGVVLAVGLVVAGLSPRVVAAQNLIANPGFETGTFAGWNLSGNTAEFVGVDDFLPHSGTFAAFFGPVDSPGFLSQAVATVPGTTYEVSFWLNVEPDSFVSTFTFDWDAVNELTLVNLQEAPYKQYTLMLQAIDGSTTVRFGFRNDDSFFDLDDVSVIAVPEPASVVLAAMGLIALAAWSRRKCWGR